MTALDHGLRAMAAARLRAVYDGVDAAAAAAATAAGPAEAPSGGTPAARAASVRAAGEAAATRACAVVDAAVAREAERLRPLAVALDWLTDTPVDRSLAVALASEAAPGWKGVPEVAGLLGIARAEAAALTGDAPSPVDRVPVLAAAARVRLGRLVHRIEQWLEART